MEEIQTKIGDIPIKKEEAPKEIIIRIEAAPKPEEPKPEPPQVEELDPKDKYSLEAGRYKMYGPESGEIAIDTIELKSITGAHRVWKVKSLDKKQIILDVIKFG